MGGISRFVCFCAYLSFCVGTAASAVEHPAIYSALLHQNQPAPESHFNSLDSAINYYHELNRHGPWPRLEKGPLLRQGDRHPQVVILRQQLMLLGDYGRLTLVTRDEQYFDQALDEARMAAERGEVPVGAVIVAPDGPVLARAGNRTRELSDPTAHAETLAIREACAVIGSERLVGHDLYVTLEPCPMCAAAISHARIRRLYFGAFDPKGGGVEFGPRIYDHDTCHHKPEVYGGIGEAQSARLLKEFFAAKR